MKNFDSIIKSVVIFSFLLSVNFVSAQEYQSSIGLRLGTYSALSYTNNFSESRGIEVLTGITREANQSNYIFGGFYKIQNHVTSNLPTLSYYLGLGTMVNFQKEEGGRSTYLAPGAITGMEYSLEYAPVNFFLDLTTYYQKNLESTLNFHANLGVRYILRRE